MQRGYGPQTGQVTMDHKLAIILAVTRHAFPFPLCFAITLVLACKGFDETARAIGNRHAKYNQQIDNLEGLVARLEQSLNTLMSLRCVNASMILEPQVTGLYVTHARPHTCAHTPTSTKTHTPTHPHTQTLTDTQHRHSHKHTRTHARTHAQTNIHTHARTHTHN